jgi:hypothetical protein
VATSSRCGSTCGAILAERSYCKGWLPCAHQYNHDDPADPSHSCDDPPAWLVEEITKHSRSFFWVGKKLANGGHCLVAWDNVCKSTRYGGLGVKNLRLQGLALRARSEWLQRTDLNRPWQGLKLNMDLDAVAVFQSFAKISLGHGKRVFF